ncbi:MAG: hypothetical protein R2883_08920, partial [Caldisericia bacterium]
NLLMLFSIGRTLSFHDVWMKQIKEIEAINSNCSVFSIFKYRKDKKIEFPLTSKLKADTIIRYFCYLSITIWFLIFSYYARIVCFTYCVFN